MLAGDMASFNQIMDDTNVVNAKRVGKTVKVDDKE